MQFLKLDLFLNLGDFGFLYKVKPRFNGLMRKCSCPLFEKTRTLPSLDAHNAFWLKSLYYCYVAET